MADGDMLYNEALLDRERQGMFGSPTLDLKTRFENVTAEVRRL
jgi:hypothetical protein